MTGIVERAVASVNADTATASFVVSKPSGTASGDVLIGIVGQLVTNTITPPSGWTSIELESADANIRLQAWYKVAGGSEPSTYTWSVSATKGFAWIGCYENVDNTTPVDVSNDGNSTTTNTVTASATLATAADWLITTAVGRHAFNTARSLSTSDGSDVNRYTHGSASVSGFDYVAAVWDSARDLTTGSASRTLTTNTGTETGLSWLAIALKPATPPTLKARVVQAALTAPQALPPLRGRVVQAALTAPAPSGGKTARVVQAALVAPLPPGSPGRSGAYIAAGGNIKRVAVYTAKAGQVV